MVMHHCSYFLTHLTDFQCCDDSNASTVSAITIHVDHCFLLIQTIVVHILFLCQHRTADKKRTETLEVSRKVHQRSQKLWPLVTPTPRTYFIYILQCCNVLWKTFKAHGDLRYFSICYNYENSSSSHSKVPPAKLWSFFFFFYQNL